MKGSAFAVAFVAIAATACGRTELAAQPDALTLAAQGVRTTTPHTFTIPISGLTNPCTGEIYNGFVTFTDVVTVVTDASGGTHTQAKVTYSGTYTGDQGTMFTEAGNAHAHLNLPSSGVVNDVAIFNSVVTGDDGTAFLAKERFLFVLDANGVVRVDRNNIETNAYRCQRS